MAESIRAMAWDRGVDNSVMWRWKASDGQSADLNGREFVFCIAKKPGDVLIRRWDSKEVKAEAEAHYDDPTYEPEVRMWIGGDTGEIGFQIEGKTTTTLPRESYYEVVIYVPDNIPIDKMRRLSFIKGPLSIKEGACYAY